MFRISFKTPLAAAFFCSAILAACTSNQPGKGPVHKQCSNLTTAISSVQGNGTTTGMLGQRVVIRGVVTLVQNQRGIYVEQAEADSETKTSNAVFVQTTTLSDDIGFGSLISVEGEVSEIGKGRSTLTALTNISDPVLCESSGNLPLTDIKLPLGNPEREALEGMRININDPMVVSNAYQFARGKITLSGNGLQFVPTEVITPGAETIEFQAINRAYALPVLLPDTMDFPSLLVNGNTVNEVTGVMAQDDRGLRLALQSISTFSDSGYGAPATAPEGSLRIVGMNLHNYFNGDGNSQGFPTPRGAETAEEFQLQRQRIGAAIRVLDPHVLAVMELENDGFAANSSAQDFINLARDASGKNWAVTRPVDDNTGTDQITVGIFYRSDQLKPVGPAQTLVGGEFELSRQPQAQLFQQLPDGENILIVINHLKSKGSCPNSGENANQKDGQGCWNPIRRVSAQKMSAWAKRIAASSDTANILILGDMNAYRHEDPIMAIRNAGFTELMDIKAEANDQARPYSFAYFGQHGTLDYAFSSVMLLDKVQQAFIWNVNVALPANMDLPEPWLRFSDHDPVIVDVSLRHSRTSD